MYEDRTQNYEPEIREEYLIRVHDTPFLLPHHLMTFIAMCRHSYYHN